MESFSNGNRLQPFEGHEEDDIVVILEEANFKSNAKTQSARALQRCLRRFRLRRE
jgi:hypothetical protein